VKPSIIQRAVMLGTAVRLASRTPRNRPRWKLRTTLVGLALIFGTFGLCAYGMRAWWVGNPQVTYVDHGTATVCALLTAYYLVAVRWPQIHAQALQPSQAGQERSSRFAYWLAVPLIIGMAYLAGWLGAGPGLAAIYTGIAGTPHSEQATVVGVYDQSGRGSSWCMRELTVQSDSGRFHLCTAHDYSEAGPGEVVRLTGFRTRLGFKISHIENLSRRAH
jgi:hypothetical protein